MVGFVLIMIGWCGNFILGVWWSFDWRFEFCESFGVGVGVEFKLIGCRIKFLDFGIF